MHIETTGRKDQLKKSMLALALAGAIGASTAALAQSSTVQVFGTMYLEYTVRANQGDAAPGVARTNADFIQTPGSEIGFKGEEKLGGGLSAWFQCTSTADPRGQSQNGWCARNSALGLKGSFGNVFIGNWDTPFKRAAGPTAVGGNDTGIFGTAFLLLGDSTTTAVNANRAAFKRRQQNLISYDSPTFGGFQVMAAFTSAQTSTGTLETATNNKPRLWSVGAQYSAGPLYVSGGYEQHREFAGTSPDGSHDSGWHIGAAYTWGPVRFGGQYTEQRFDVPVGVAGGDVKARAWHAGVDWKIAGPHGLRAAVTQARDMRGARGVLVGTASGAGYRPVNVAAGDTGALLWQIRYVYAFSKRTEFTAGYVRLNNDSNAAYRLGGLGAAIANGQDESAVAFAVRHTF
jgi:predicted porin